MTPLFDRIVREHRALVIALVAGILANVLGYALIVRPRGERAHGATDRAAAAAGARTAAERDQKLAHELVTGQRQADDELGKFYGTVLPASREEARRMLDQRLPAIADETNVEWLKRSSEVVRDADDSRLGQLAVTMVLQGEYDDLRDFLYALESAPHFIIVDDVNLSESRPEEPLTLLVTMSTYFRKADGA